MLLSAEARPTVTTTSQGKVGGSTLTQSLSASELNAGTDEALEGLFPRKATLYLGNIRHHRAAVGVWELFMVLDLP